MPKEKAGLGATLVAVLVVFGLLVLIAIILWMTLWAPGIRHSPSRHGSVFRAKPQSVAHNRIRSVLPV